MKKNIYRIMSLLAIALVGLSLTACSEDDLDTNQYGAGVRLNVYGPQPVMRGGQLRFLGSNLDQIAQVVIPGCDPITNIEIVKSGIPSEIRVTLPKDGPEVGLVKLITKTDDEITTKTELTYIEGIEFEAFSPASVMPGETLTIKGEYLNLVRMIEFAEGVYVSEKDFVSHDRYAIEVVVPEEARTGKVNLYDVDLTAIDNSDTDVSYNIIATEDVLNVGTPVVAKFASPRGEAEAMGTVVAKMGEQITVSGDYFNLIAGLKFGSEDNVFETDEITISEDGKTLTFNLPEEAPEGDFNIVCRSGVEVPVGIIETVAPSNCVAVQSPVKAGMPLTITGNDMDVVYSIEMPNVEADVEIAFTKAADGKSVVITAVPDAAQEGNLVLRMKNGKGVEVAFTLVKPVVTGYDNATVSAGGALTIQGTDLDLVKTVQFGEGSDIVAVTPAEDGKSITLTVPMNAVSGEPTLTLANGTTVTGKSIAIQEAVFCYITELPDDENIPDAGSTLTVPVKNGDKLTNVYVNGEEVKFVYDSKNSKLTFGIPDNASATSVLKLVSSNGQIEYSLSVKPATSVANVVFTGPLELTWNDGGRVFIADTAFDNIPAGAKLMVEFLQTDAWGQVQFNDAAWANDKINFPEIGGAYLNTDNCGGKDVKVFELTLTDEILVHLREVAAEKGEGNGMIIQGQDWIITKISITYEISLETAIWTGSWSCSGWAGNQDLAWGGYDWSGVKSGTIIRFYYTKIDASAWGCISLRHGDSWGALPEPVPGQYDFPDDEASGVVEVQLPQNVIDDISGNGGLVITGDNFILEKVTIE